MMRSGSDADSYVTLGDAIGVLRSEPDQLERGLGLKFRDAHDDLDALRIARFRVADGRLFALVRHRHAPEPGTQIVMITPSTDLWGDITAVLRRLQMTPNDLAWRHPGAMPREKASRAATGVKNRLTPARSATRRGAMAARAAARKK